MSSKVSRDTLYEVVREVLPGNQPEVFGDGGASGQPEELCPSEGQMLPRHCQA